MKRAIWLLASGFLALCLQGTALAQEPGAVRLILKGHDPVAYFTDAKPVKGNPKISYEWDEGRYYFASTKNRDTFVSDPDRYAPRFGGYCTGSMSRGVRNEGDPEAWIIADGKLYVFGQVKFQQMALQDPTYLSSRIPKATENWKK